MAEVEATLALELAIGAVLESPVPVPTSEQTIESNGNDSKLDESLNVIPENTVLETPIIDENAGPLDAEIVPSTISTTVSTERPKVPLSATTKRAVATKQPLSTTLAPTRRPLASSTSKPLLSSSTRAPRISTVAVPAVSRAPSDRAARIAAASLTAAATATKTTRPLAPTRLSRPSSAASDKAPPVRTTRPPVVSPAINGAPTTVRTPRVSLAPVVGKAPALVRGARLSRTSVSNTLPPPRNTNLAFKKLVGTDESSEELEQKSKQLTEAQAALAQSQSNFLTLQSSTSSLTSDLSAAQASLSAAKLSLASSASTVEQLTSDHAIAIEKLREEKDGLSSEHLAALEAFDAQLKDVTLSLEASDIKRQEAVAEVEAYEKEVEGLNTSIIATEALGVESESSLSEAKVEAEIAVKRVKELEGELEEAKKSAESTNAYLISIQLALDESKKYATTGSDRISQLELELVELTEANNKLVALLEEIKAGKEKVEFNFAEAISWSHNLEEEMTQARLVNKVLVEERAATSAKIIQLEGSIATMTTSHATENEVLVVQHAKEIEEINASNSGEIATLSKSIEELKIDYEARLVESQGELEKALGASSTSISKMEVEHRNIIELLKLDHEKSLAEGKKSEESGDVESRIQSATEALQVRIDEMVLEREISEEESKLAAENMHTTHAESLVTIRSAHEEKIAEHHQFLQSLRSEGEATLNQLRAAHQGELEAQAIASATMASTTEAERVAALTILTEELSVLEKTIDELQSAPIPTKESDSIITSLQSDLETSRKEASDATLALQRTQQDLSAQIDAVSRMSDVEREAAASEFEKSIISLKLKHAADLESLSAKSEVIPIGSPPATPSKSMWSSSPAKIKPSPSQNDLTDLHKASSAKLLEVETKAKVDREALEAIIEGLERRVQEMSS